MEMDNFQILVFTAVATVIVFVAMYWYLHYEVEGVRLYYKDKTRQWMNIIFLLLAAFIVKAIMAAHFKGYETDMNCFYSWSDMIYDNGFGEFYKLDAFTDYPPGYMAILWVIAAVRHLFSIETASTVGRVLIKLVPILADLGAGFLIYTLAKRKFSEGSSLLLAATYVMNPIVVLDSSVWGQTDGVFTLFVLLTCYLCMEKKRIPAYFVFAAGVLIKPQMLVFTPILIWTIVEQVFLKDFNWKKMLKDLACGVGAIAAMVLCALPFGIGEVFSQYVETLGSYQYCSTNAYNVWTLFGKNWADQNGKFLFLEYHRWGTLAIIVAVIISGLVFFKMKEDKSKYFISPAIVIGTMFLFSVRMHERYLFPAVGLLAFAFLVKPTKEIFFTYVGFSVVQFLNVGHVLYYFDEYQTTGVQGGFLGMTALLTIAVYAYLFFAAFSKSTLEDLKEALPAKKKRRGPVKKYIIRPGAERKKKEYKPEKVKIRPSEKIKKMGSVDWIVLGVIMIVYSAFALFDLGKMSAPETEWEVGQYGNYDDKVITLDIGENRNIKMLHTYLGNYEARRFNLDMSQDGKSYERVGEVRADSVFCWNELQRLTTKEDGTQERDNADTYNLLKDYRYIRLEALDDNSVLKELVIVDKDDNILKPVNASDYKELFDEQDDYEDPVTFRSGTYFDEVYHARTAYEMIDGIYCYENTHPPLGKFFISLGVRAFGMNPFGWRIVGVLFGIAMLPFMFFFGRRLFGGKTWAAGALTFLFAFDFMHFTQTRISTIDVYGTFFIIAMFFFMYWYSQISFYDTPLWKTFIPLGLSAVMMGLGCASKWTAVYAAAGLGIFFFAIVFRRYWEYRLAKKNPSGETEGIRHEHIIHVFPRNLIKTLAFCVLFFIVIAGAIYLLSYIPFNDGRDTGLVDRMLVNQDTMFGYHSKLNSDHPYSSSWDEWPLMIKPMYYYCQTVGEGIKEGISAFGNPLVWWAGIPAFLYMVYLIFRRRDRKALFLVFAFAVQYVPWILVPRCTFAYHYFPSVPFLAMMIVYTMYLLVKENQKWFKWVLIYLGAAFILFLMFYPVLSGQPVLDTYVRDGLKWLPEWVLVS